MIQFQIDFEWIVIDGGSHDGTVEFLKGVKGFPIKWISESDGGIYDAMNKGMDISKGYYILFLNAGDMFSHESVLCYIQERIIHEECEPDMVFGGATLVFPSGKHVYRAPRLMESYIWHGLPANHQATYFRKDFLNDLKYCLDYKICGDYYFVARLFKKGASVSYIDKPLVNFSVGGASYVNLTRLFCEPYRIQRDILVLGFFSRIRSVIKRAFSTFGFKLLSQEWAKPLAMLSRRTQAVQRRGNVNP